MMGIATLNPSYICGTSLAGNVYLSFSSSQSADTSDASVR